MAYLVDMPEVIGERERLHPARLLSDLRVLAHVPGLVLLVNEEALHLPHISLQGAAADDLGREARLCGDKQGEDAIVRDEDAVRAIVVKDEKDQDVHLPNEDAGSWEKGKEKRGARIMALDARRIRVGTHFLYAP